MLASLGEPGALEMTRVGNLLALARFAAGLAVVGATAATSARADCYENIGCTDMLHDERRQS